jgi:hypothetical protein
VRWHVRCLADGYPLRHEAGAGLPFVVPEGLLP